MPRGRPAKVDHVRDAFLEECKKAEALVAAIRALPRKVNASKKPGIHPKYSDQVIGLAFMGLIASWEEFIERSLVRYLTGATTGSNYQPHLKAGRANTIGHAYKLLSMNPNYNPNNFYLKVTNVSWVKKVADFYFSKHPFECLHNNNDLLKHASHIRNRIAHDSTKCKADFKATALHFLQPANKMLTQGYGPANLLMAPVQRHFGQAAINQQLTHLAAYVDLLRSLARKIVP